MVEAPLRSIGRITALSLRGTEVAYVRLAPWGEWTRSDLWLQQPGSPARLIDRTGTGGGAAYGSRTFLSPTIDDGWLYAYRQFRELGQAWVRWPVRSASMIHTQAEAPLPELLLENLDDP